MYNASILTVYVNNVAVLLRDAGHQHVSFALLVFAGGLGVVTMCCFGLAITFMLESRSWSDCWPMVIGTQCFIAIIASVGFTDVLKMYR